MEQTPLPFSGSLAPRTRGVLGVGFKFYSMPKQKDTAPLSTNKVYQVLQLFEKSELKKLMKFLQSPYFNNSKTLIALCEIFLDLIEKGQKEGFSKELVWKKILPKEKFDDVNFRKYSSDLLKLIESFIKHESIENDLDESNVTLYKNVSKKKKLKPL